MANGKGQTAKGIGLSGHNIKARKEVEVFGVTYDRYVLLQLHKLLARSLDLRDIVEMPSHGAKAAGSLYSIGFGLAGCNVTLVNPELEMMFGWNELGIQQKVTTALDKDVYHTGFSADSFDLSWNFVTWTELADPARYIEEMKRISKKYVLLITCNNFQPGYPWHRFLHLIFGFPWTHGQVEYNHITRVKKLFRQSGMKIVEYGAIDTPGWPDPSGPRDVRLHRRYGGGNLESKKPTPDWEVPIIGYAKTGQFPGWMKELGRWDMRFRKGVFKLPLSHLFYVMGIK
jgi:SAM-dependent methyltransferase